MYQITASDPFFVTTTGDLKRPIITLSDEYGGRSQIAIDDHCYVLYNKKINTNHYVPATHWYEEAVHSLHLYSIMKTNYKMGLIESIGFLS